MVKGKQNKKKRFNAVKFNLDDVPSEELKTLKFGIRNTGLGIEIEIRTDKRKIETDFVTGYQRPPKPTKPGFNLKNTNVITDTTLTNVEQNIIKFNWLIAIDTNTLTISGQKVHLGVVVEIENMTLENGKFINPKMRYETHFIFAGECEKPELMNWKNLIEYIVKSNGYSPKLKIGIIVDSELDNIPAYNKRQKAIVNDFFLPINFELMYASADTQNDSVLNQAISFCDKTASQFLKAMKIHS